VGSIYLSTNSMYPGDYFDGEWEPWGEGRVPVGVSPFDLDFAYPDLTGGEKTVTLTTDEMPEHTHTVNNRGWYLTGTLGTNAVISRYPSGTATVDVNRFTTNPTGEGEGHSNLQPYITCYMWRRVG